MILNKQRHCPAMQKGEKEMYRILLVEDDAALRYMYARMHAWQTQGFCLAAEAANGKEALEKLAEECFDLIVTDIRMPFIDGLELLRALRQRENHTPVILISSYGEFEYAREGLVLGAFDYIVKPFQESALDAVLARAAAYLLGTGGAFFTVYRPDRLSRLLTALSAAGLEPKRLRPVAADVLRAPSLVLVESVKGAAEGMVYEKNLVIYRDSAHTQYTDELERIYHVFS